MPVILSLTLNCVTLFCLLLWKPCVLQQRTKQNNVSARLEQHPAAAASAGSAHCKSAPARSPLESRQPDATTAPAAALIVVHHPGAAKASQSPPTGQWHCLRTINSLLACNRLSTRRQQLHQSTSLHTACWCAPLPSLSSCNQAKERLLLDQPGRYISTTCCLQLLSALVTAADIALIAPLRTAASCFTVTAEKKNSHSCTGVSFTPPPAAPFPGLAGSCCCNMPPPAVFHNMHVAQATSPCVEPMTGSLGREREPTT